MKFYVGTCKLDGVIPADAIDFDYVFISVDELYSLNTPFDANRWIMDSGGFNEIRKHGTYRHTAKRYADEIARWADCGLLEMAVAQDYPCDLLSRTMSAQVFDVMPEIMVSGRRRANPELVRLHQELSVERYDELIDCKPVVPIMPALQGTTPAEYVEHLRMFGDRVKKGMRIGVGALVWRSGRPKQIAEILIAIKQARPDIKLHGLGLKKVALRSHEVCSLLYSADSMAWRKSAFYELITGTHVTESGRVAGNGYDQTWKHAPAARRYEQQITDIVDADKKPITPFFNRQLP